MTRAGKPWRWIPSTTLSQREMEWHLRDGRGRERATVWSKRDGSFIWHTWDDMGTGGENSECTSLRDAKDQAMAAIVRQGWAPGGWKVQW